MFANDDHAALRRYVIFGFERLAQVLECPKVEHIALYGSLMGGFDEVVHLDVAADLKYVGDCLIRGSLYDLGEYPGLMPGEDEVGGELYEDGSFDVFRKLDVFERYNAAEPESIESLR